jgi:hypothetical protein
LNDGRVELHRGAIRHVEFPADPDERVAGLEEKRIAEILCGAEVAALREIEHADHASAAAIRNLEQRGAVTFRRVLGSEDEQVGREFDQTLSVPRSAIDVDDDLVRGELGIDGEVELAGDLLLVDEREVDALGDFDSGDGRVGERGDKNQGG